MIFDTGASISTLDSRTLAELGMAKFQMMPQLYSFVLQMD